jgi:hypothetical protein
MLRYLWMQETGAACAEVAEPVPGIPYKEPIFLPRSASTCQIHVRAARTQKLKSHPQLIVSAVLTGAKGE